MSIFYSRILSILQLKTVRAKKDKKNKILYVSIITGSKLDRKKNYS